MTDSVSRRILTLTSWRGIFALGVVLFHSGEKMFMELATGGVVGFFVMSGFLLRMWHDPAQLRGARHRSFFLMRALRIYPLHWLALALLLAECLALHMPLTYGNCAALLPNLLLLQSYVPCEQVFFSFNTPSWFLCDLLLCSIPADNPGPHPALLPSGASPIRVSVSLSPQRLLFPSERR